MAKTLNANYQRNIEILQENLKRGLSYDQATKAIDNMQDQFINANLYNQVEKNYINDMRAVVVSHFSKIDVKIIK